ncbi:MAG: two-component regulator propeller domain-containing protein [Terrisporobacter sp.]
MKICSKLKSLSIRDIMKDSSGNIWMATDKGISQYINDEAIHCCIIIRAYDNNGLRSTNIVFTLMEDESGLIWAGTYTGVSIFDSKNIIELHIKNDPHRY